MKKINLIFLIPFLIEIAFGQTNVVGGDITWSCNGTGDFIFQLKLQVQCGGAALPVNQTIGVFNFPGISAIPVSLITQTDLSPNCSNGTPISCASGGLGAVAEYIYISSPITLSGTPPPGGWIFTFSDCCRASNTNFQTGSGTGYTFYSKMYSYISNTSSPCKDNSPNFFTNTPTILSSGISQQINLTAFDPDHDSIAINWTTALNNFTGSFTPPSNPSPVTYSTGYTFLSPLPSPLQGLGNSGAQLNSNTGEINFTAQQNGNFTCAVVVESWRCGIKIAEVYKEFQLISAPNTTNSPPLISAPFSGTYETTVMAGAVVNYAITASDSPQQYLTWDIYGDVFGTNFSSTSAGCTQPPCATLNPTPPLVSQGTNSLSFSWQTDCAHLGQDVLCPSSLKTFHFYFIAQDDSCPIPGIRYQSILIHLTSPPILPSPEIKCVNVSSSNDVTFTWSIPADPTNSFHHYTLYDSNTLNGIYDQVAGITNYNQNQFTIPAGANVLSDYYFIRAFGCSGYVASPPTDTVRPILLTVNNPANGTALLFWNNFTQPLPTTSCNYYRIYKEYPSGIWTLIDSTIGNSFTDTITVCQATINYRVEICDQIGCVSTSTVDGDLFFDQTDPDIPNLDSVSINSIGNAVLGWSASNSNDVIAYIVYQQFGGIYVPIDTLLGLNSTFYNYLNSNADAGSETFVIAALDSCGNISNLGAPQHTIFLQINFDKCNRACNISWNQYINMINGGVGSYELLFSVNGGPFNLLQSLNSTFYLHDSLIPGTTICYRVRARSANGNITSVSNRECFTVTSPQQPGFFYLKRITVNALQQIEIDGLVDNSVGISLSGFNLFRAENFSGPYQLIGSQPYSGNANFTIIDTDVNTSDKNYSYFMIVKDSCNNPGLKTDTSTTILCKVSPNDDFTNTINWSEYGRWLGGINTYSIYRSINGIFAPTPIATVLFTGAGNYSYSDNIEQFTPNDGKFEYRIEAEEGPGNPYGISERSSSNLADVYREAEIFVPNAFSPKGYNKIFLPVTQFVSKSDYDLKIYNRWGLVIWETKDDTEGWDGGNNEGGVYIWQVQYKNARGEYIEKIGKVVLLR